MYKQNLTKASSKSRINLKIVLLLTVVVSILGFALTKVFGQYTNTFVPVSSQVAETPTGEIHLLNAYQSDPLSELQVNTDSSKTIPLLLRVVILNIYNKVLKGKNDQRWRIEHAQVVHPDDFHLFGDYSIIPSVQTTHATSDMRWAGERLGKERVKYAYAYASLMKQNGWLANGTDFPVENINPVYSFYAAVARKDLKGWPEGGFQKENALSREQALRSITIWAARGCFMEKFTGSLEKGKVADFVVLDQDLMKAEESKIPLAKVLRTVIEGEEMLK